MEFVQTTLTLEINGETRSVPSLKNLRDLIAFLGITPDRIAVEVNRRIIRRDDWENTLINDQDKVEIVQFVGGG